MATENEITGLEDMTFIAGRFLLMAIVVVCVPVAIVFGALFGVFAGAFGGLRWCARMARKLWSFPDPSDLRLKIDILKNPLMGPIR